MKRLLDVLRREDGFVHFGTIYGVHGEHRTPYMTRAWIGRLRLHIFHRGDADPDPHDHPWDFWTFPLTSYVEEVTRGLTIGEINSRKHPWNGGRRTFRQIVPAFRWSFRPAEHTHRVLGRYDRAGLRPWAGDRDAHPAFKAGRIVTLVWRGRQRRKWGFLKLRDGRWCWVAWRDYVFGGGKHAPCEPPAGGAR